MKFSKNYKEKDFNTFHKMRNHFLLFYCLIPIFSFGQLFEEIPLELKDINGLELKDGFNGGNNAPQLGKIDINLDGFDDLYVFDRDGSTHQIYIFDPDEPHKYKYSTAYNHIFPTLKHWVLLRDYNNDGLVDIFTYSNVPGIPGIEVYKQKIENSKITFEKILFPNKPYDLLYENDNLIYVASGDYPEINDLDNDGDLDIISFENAGIRLQFYQNMSIENNSSLENLTYNLTDNCYGKFVEGADDNQVFLSTNMNECAANISNPIGPRHSGSTLLAFDEDIDGDYELLLGDNGATKINRLLNGGNETMCFITDQDPNFPSYTESINVNDFPAAFYLDVNDDNFKDLVMAPNAALGSYDIDVFHLYTNDGLTSANQFSPNSSFFLNTTALDLGSLSKPAFIDINNDGLLDIIVGNRSRFAEGLNEFYAQLTYLKNIGTATVPKYKIEDPDYLGFISENYTQYGLAPSFGDLDGDGDLDLMVGTLNGQLIYFENIGIDGTVDWASPIFNYAGISEFGAIKPSIFDLNEDGLNDIILGLNNGSINYYANQGSINNPSFDSDINNGQNIGQLGGVDTRIPGETNGRSAPHFYKWGTEINLLAGSHSGHIFQYDNITNNLDGTFDLINENVGQNNGGENVFFDMALVDDDNIYDIILGNARGGLQYYKSNIYFDGTTGTAKPTKPGLVIIPNPFNESLYIKNNISDFKYSVYNLMGQRLIVGQNKAQEKILLKTLSQGIYYIQISTLDGKIMVTKKVVKSSL